MVPLFGAAYAAPNRGTTVLYGFRSRKTLLNPPVNGKIQGLFKVFECFSSTFQGKFYFQGLFKRVLYIQVLFKPVRTLYTTERLLMGLKNQIKQTNKQTTKVAASQGHPYSKSLPNELFIAEKI